MEALHRLFLLTLLVCGFCMLQIGDISAKTTNHPFKVRGVKRN